jgi:hypothetical protein
MNVSGGLLIWAGPVLLTAAAALLASANRGSRIALKLVILLTVADLVAYGASYAVWNRTSTLATFIASAPRPPEASDQRIIADRSIDNDGLEVGNRMMLQGVGRIDGYAGLKPRRLLDYSDRNQLRLAGVGWSYQSRNVRGDGQGESPWIELEPPMARARLVSQTRVGNSFAGWSSDRFADCALVDAPVNVKPSQPGTVSIALDAPGRLKLQAKAPAEQILVLTESYHDGWKATIDGTSAPVIRVNRDFLGCLVPAGNHHIELVFQPASLRLGKAISAGGLGLLVAAVALAWLPRPGRTTRRKDLDF